MEEIAHTEFPTPLSGYPGFVNFRLNRLTGELRVMVRASGSQAGESFTMSREATARLIAEIKESW